MCIMEVRPGQKSSTIAEAMAHNVSTVERDMDLFRALMKARGDDERLRALDHVQGMLTHAYADLLEMFGEEVNLEVADWEGHVPHSHGNERTLTEQAHRDAGEARRFETR